MSGSPSIRDTFFEECEELIEALTEGLQRIEAENHDDETLNAVFRAVHSIKGGAGAFALDDLVAFTHRFETLLDGMRSGRQAFTPEVMRVVLRSADHLAALIEAARAEQSIAAETTATFIANLDALLGGSEGLDTMASELDLDACFGFAALPLGLDLGADIASADAALGTDAAPTDAGPIATRRIRVQPHIGFSRNGHDPLLLIETLHELGASEIQPDLSRMPQWPGSQSDAIWLGWSAELPCNIDRAQIHGAFDFAEGLVDIIELAAAPETPAAAAALAPIVQASAPDLTPLQRARQSDDDGEGRTPKPTLRVDLERVDRLINTVGELIINQAMIEQSILDLKLPTDAEVIAHVEDYRLLARDLQEAVMAIRAQPVKPLFQRMSRILREAAEATGKQARLVTSGEMTEVDKTLIERLTDPLTHMIRNAIDHGLELPEHRLAAGNPAEGNVHLSAAHRSGSVTITLRDDGAGLDRPRILARAIERGLVAPGVDLTEAEIDNLLFAPGFSTAEKISKLSGRGVGLDVVRNAVTALGGRIAIASTHGKGSEFTISLPLTLAVMDGMVISAAGQTMVIPIASVIETIRPAPSDLHLLGTSEWLLAVRGSYLPMLDVAESLGMRRRATSHPPLILVVETEAHSLCGLVVDAVHDQRQVVIKGLETNYGEVPGISAATVLGDGQIALILDVEALTSTRLGAAAPARVQLTDPAHPLISGEIPHGCSSILH